MGRGKRLKLWKAANRRSRSERLGRDRNTGFGRLVNTLDDDMREWVMGRHARGYVALYRYIAAIDTVFVLALRGQREAGYTNP